MFTPKSGIAPQNSDVDIWTAVLDLIERTRPLMAELSERELDIIKINPIKDEFKALLTTFKSTYSNAKIADSPADSPADYKRLLTDPGRCNAQFCRSS